MLRSESESITSFAECYSIKGTQDWRRDDWCNFIGFLDYATIEAPSRLSMVAEEVTNESKTEQSAEAIAAARDRRLRIFARDFVLATRTLTGEPRQFEVAEKAFIFAAHELGLIGLDSMDGADG